MKFTIENDGQKSDLSGKPKDGGFFRPSSFPAGWWYAPALIFGSFGWLAVGAIVISVVIQ